MFRGYRKRLVITHFFRQVAGVASTKNYEESKEGLKTHVKRIYIFQISLCKCVGLTHNTTLIKRVSNTFNAKITWLILLIYFTDLQLTVFILL